jgi:NTE family protein
LGSKKEEGVAAILGSRLLSGCSEEDIHSLAAAMQAMGLADRQVLVRQGEPDDGLYLVTSGRLQVSASTQRNEHRLLYELGPGDTFGEMALLANHTSAVEVRALDHATVAKLTANDFQRFAERHPTTAFQMTEAMSKGLCRHRLAAALHLGRHFESLDAAALRDLESELELMALYAGEVLYRQGEAGDFMCIVISGRLRVVATGVNNAEFPVDELGSGETVGEMALMSGEARSATVYAIRDTQLARLSKGGMLRFLTRHPEAAFQMLTRPLVSRLRRMTTGAWREPSTVTTIALVPASPDAPLEQFSSALLKALSAFGPAIAINSRMVDEHLGKKNIAQTWERQGRNVRVAEWLNEQEAENRYVVYEADSRPSPWTERSIRQADRVLVVADARGNPALGEIEEEVLRMHDARTGSRPTLALVHSAETGEPSGTSEWLRNRTVERFHHVRLGHGEDFARLARFLTGRAVGLALGGGFARGMAHIGVFRAMRELGLPIDAIGGASMGTLIAGQWALGWDEQQMIQRTREACNVIHEDYTFPFLAFKSGRRFSEMVQGLFGDTQIEDLWTPYFGISANLNRAELAMHTSGSLTKAVLVGTRAPGVFPPIVLDGELHVDGGVMNNVPVDLMKDFCNRGIVIGVDVSPPHELKSIPDYGNSFSGWRELWSRFNPLRANAPVPNILLVLMRTLEFGGISYRTQKAQLADLIIAPPMLAFERTDFHLAADIVETGYRCALETISEWRSGRAAPAA